MTDWFALSKAAPGVTLVTEPLVNSFFRANGYAIQGSELSVAFDFGIGLRPWRPALPLRGPILAVASHAHADHVGGFHEFDTRLGHPAEIGGFETMSDAATLKHLFRTQRYGPGVARPGFALGHWDLTPAPLTGALFEGSRIDLGDRRFTVLHLPGHSPGSIALFDEVAGLLISGDAVYDDDLVDEIPGASIPAYCQTMERLRQFDCAQVLGGHGAPFDRARLRQIAEAYLRQREALA